jgi:hypothetical protein
MVIGSQMRQTKKSSIMVKSEKQKLASFVGASSWGVSGT